MAGSRQVRKTAFEVFLFMVLDTFLIGRGEVFEKTLRQIKRALFQKMCGKQNRALKTTRKGS